jgi:hypothetical protein
VGFNDLPLLRIDESGRLWKRNTLEPDALQERFDLQEIETFQRFSD